MERADMPDRTCTKCGETKQLTDFYRDASKPSGRRRQCAECVKAYVKSKNNTHETACVVCGNTWTAWRPDTSYCSQECRAQDEDRTHSHRKRGHAFTESNTYVRSDGRRECRRCRANSHPRNPPVKHPNPAPVTVLPEGHPGRTSAPPPTWWTRITTGPCHHCGTHFTAPAAGPDKPRFCSTRCSRSYHKTTRRARQHHAYRADVYRTRIHQRDNYRCQICHRKTLPSQTVPHPRAPTIDHIIPLAAGGTHEPSNVQTACFLCNCEKQDGAANDQLRLIG